MENMNISDKPQNSLYKFGRDAVVSQITEKWDGQEPFGKFLASVLTDVDTGNLSRVTTDEIETALTHYKEAVTAGS